MDTKCSCGKQWTEAEFYALPALLGKCDCGLAIITGVHRLTCASAKPWIIENDAPCDCMIVNDTSRHLLGCASLTKTVKYESVLCDACGTHRARLVKEKSEARQELEDTDAYYKDKAYHGTNRRSAECVKCMTIRIVDKAGVCSDCKYPRHA